MKTLEEIQSLAKKFADARGVVKKRVDTLQDEINSAKRRLIPGITTAVASARDAQSELERAIAESRSLFVSPKSITVHGIRCGVAKGKGKVTWAKGSTEKIVAAIEKKLSEKASVLIKIEKKPIKAALSALSVDELKSIGCTVIGAGEHVFVKATDDDVDKLVAALLDQQTDEDDAE